MSNTSLHINEYVSRLLSNRNFFASEYKKYIENCYVLQNVTGDIAPEILKALICKAKRNGKARKLLSGVLCFVDKKSITDENFRLLLSFRGQSKITFLSNIAHAELAFYQMQILNRFPLSFEAFAWLFNHISEYDFFSEEDMLQILRENADVTDIGIRMCIDSAVKKYGTSNKIDVAIAWLDRLNR